MFQSDRKSQCFEIRREGMELGNKSSLKSRFFVKDRLTIVLNVQNTAKLVGVISSDHVLILVVVGCGCVQ